MSNSFFDDKIPESYCVSIISFDDDYYYGQLYRRYEKGFKQFLCGFKLDLDENALVTLDEVDFLDRQICIDFEIDLDETQNDRVLLFLDMFESELFKTGPSIFKTIKQHGGTYHQRIR